MTQVCAVNGRTVDGGAISHKEQLRHFRPRASHPPRRNAQPPRARQRHTNAANHHVPAPHAQSNPSPRTPLQPLCSAHLYAPKRTALRTYTHRSAHLYALLCAPTIPICSEGKQSCAYRCAEQSVARTYVTWARRERHPRSISIAMNGAVPRPALAHRLAWNGRRVRGLSRQHAVGRRLRNGDGRKSWPGRALARSVYPAS